MYVFHCLIKLKKKNSMDYILIIYYRNCVISCFSDMNINQVLNTSFDLLSMSYQHIVILKGIWCQNGLGTFTLRCMAGSDILQFKSDKRGQAKLGYLWREMLKVHAFPKHQCYTCCEWDVSCVLGNEMDVVPALEKSVVWWGRWAVKQARGSGSAEWNGTVFPTPKPIHMFHQDI